MMILYSLEISFFFLLQLIDGTISPTQVGVGVNLCRWLNFFFFFFEKGHSLAELSKAYLDKQVSLRVDIEFEVVSTTKYS